MKREAQATVVANAVAEVDGGRGSHTIILGDYNTFNENALDANDNHPIDNTALILENAAGAIGSQGKDHSTGGYFGKEDGVDVVGMLPQSLRYSEWWDRNDDCVYDPMGVHGVHEVSLLDHIIVSPGLAELITEVKIHHDWRGACVEDGGFWSDHWPVSVTFDTKAGAVGETDDAPVDGDDDDAGSDGGTHGSRGGDDEWIAVAEDRAAQCELCAELDCSGPSSASSPQLIAYGVLFFAVGITGVVCMMNGSKLAEVKRRCKRMFRGGGENEGAPDLSGPTFSPLPMSTHSLPSELPGNGL